MAAAGGHLLLLLLLLLSLRLKGSCSAVLVICDATLLVAVFGLRLLLLLH